MKAFFDGKWREGSEWIDVLNPYTSEKIDEVPNCGAEVIDVAVSCLGQGARILSKMGREELHQIFARFHELMGNRVEEFSRLLTTEQGKPIVEARVEVDSALSSAELLADNPSLIGSAIQPLAKEASLQDRYGFTIRHPHGVVAIITPNPQPLVIPLVNTLYALAAGNAVILKPSIHTPLVVLRMVELLLEAELPPEAIACVTGKGKTLGRALVRHSGVDHVVASGSLPTIKDIRSRMGFRTTQLQWGCVTTCVVGKSADIKTVRDQIFRVAFESSGQAAYTPTWIACFDEKYDELRDCLKEGMERIDVGDPLLERTQLGPLTELKKVNKLERRIADELSMGAEIVTGERVENQLYRPMLLGECDLAKTRFSWEEIAAPVIGMTSIRKASEATNLLRDQRHHVLTLFSKDVEWASRRAVKMPFNNVHINGIPSWRDGLICLPGHPLRTGRRSSADRVADMSHVRDVIFH